MSLTAGITSRGRGLDRALAGKIVLPDDERWDEARRAFNLAVDQRPAAVVYATGAQDVAAAVALAIERGQRIAAQATGHNAGPLGPLEDTILLKTERMRGVTIDPEARIARVEAGVQWIEVVEAAARHGLAALAGSSPNVGVVGYTLGGGLSFLGRKYGLAANSVRAIELVTPDRRLVRADRENEPDLFWALRGGGGSFGVVTALELRLFPLTEVYAGILWYPIERGGEVLDAWRELTHGAPDELTTVGRFVNLPPIPEIPEPVRGKSFVVVEAFHVGDHERADELLAPLRALGPVNDTIATISPPALTRVHMDPEAPLAGFGDGLMVSDLPDEALSAFIGAAGAGAPWPMVSVELRHLEGEFGRARPENGALAAIPARYVLFSGSPAPSPDLLAAARAGVETITRALAPWGAPAMYLNFAETSRPPGSFWSGQAYDRLRQVKAAVDPDDVIRSNHPIPPAARGANGASR